ncbi:MAG: S41 family peptidase, partial [Bacteroidota bacterium]
VGISLVAPPDNSLPDDPALTRLTQKFGNILSHIQEDYVDDRVDLKALSEEAIGKLLEQLDPHTVYITAQELSQKNIELQGELDGIGAHFTMLRGEVYIIAPISGGPSEKIGIKAGDRILKVDDEDIVTQHTTALEVAKKLQGAKGTTVKLTIARKNQPEPLEFSITRDTIPFYSVDASYMINSDIGYIKISRFAANTYKEFKAALGSLKKQGMNKLLLDLRSNPGGYVHKAVQVANQMLSQGQLIVYAKGKAEKYSTKYHAKGEDHFDECPIIVLIDEGTAAAAEILAGALQDNDRALIVGRRSFGKGLVQAPIQLNDGSQLRLTVARYYTPSGRFIQRSYNEGTEDYHAELIKRFKQGEYFRTDNIQFDETRKYQTSKKRIVYGGGGIMPDYFTPLDDSAESIYVSQLSAFVQAYALEYTDQHREKLAAMTYEQYRDKFTVSDFMLGQVITQATKAEFICDEKVFLAVKERIRLRLKACIARNVWQEQGFYPIYQQDDSELQKALALFDEAEALLRQPEGEEALP